MKTRIKGLLILCTILCMGFILSACGGVSNTENATAKKTVLNESIDIKDIDWNVDERLIFNGYDKDRRLSLNYTNSSKYKIIDVKIKFVQKQGITKKQRKVYNRILKEGMYGKAEDIYIIGENMKQANPGETVTDSVCNFNNTSGYFPNSMKEYELMEPEEMQIAFIGSDGLIHSCGYDFESKNVIKSNDTTEAYTWEDNEYSKELPKPQADVVTDAGMLKNKKVYYFEIRGADESIYKNYIKQCKDKGFTIKSKDYWNGWDAENKNGYKMNIYYDCTEELMICKLEKLKN